MKHLLVALHVLASAPPDRIAVQDPLRDARAAFVAGNYDAAIARLRDASAPGLLGRALEGAGRRDEACALYADDAARNDDRRDAAMLRHARCARRQGQTALARAAYAQLLASDGLADAPWVLVEAAHALKDLGDASTAARLVDLRAQKIDDASLDTDRREALGQALLVVVDHGQAGERARALSRLYTSLPDTDAAHGALSTADGRALDAAATLEVALARAEKLTDHHENELVLRALERFRGAPDDADDAQCRLRLLMGKAERKLRKYQAARKDLDSVAQRCGGEHKKKAQYLAARVAAITGAKGAGALLSSFAKQYADDPLADDVLLWKGDVEMQEGRADAAVATWSALLSSYPTGDMAQEARFKRALAKASMGDAAGARALLEEAARAAAGQSVEASDRAVYWQARLTAFPHLDSLTPTSDARLVDEGVRGLLALYAARPATFYGHLSRLIVEDAAKRGVVSARAVEDAKGSVRATPRAQLAVDAAAPVPPRLSSLRKFQIARALVEAGYDEEAVHLLDAVVTGARLDVDERVAVAALYARAGAGGQAHSILRDGGLALLPGTPSGDDLVSWTLDYPRAFEDAILPAATSSQVPPTLLFGLAREESAFDASIVSWAGAVGLCQLMPPTALDEAKALGLPPPSIADLREPRLNARLGAAHLGRRLRGMSHPLLAIAAYNAGPGGVQKWLDRKDRPSALDAFVETIPVDETRGYVKKVTGSWIAYSLLDGADAPQFAVVIP